MFVSVLWPRGSEKPFRKIKKSDIVLQKNDVSGILTLYNHCFFFLSFSSLFKNGCKSGDGQMGRVIARQL